MEALTLNDDQLVEILKREDIVAAFPFMRAAAERVTPVAKRGCGPCSRKNRMNLDQISGIKRAIATMEPAKKDQLKQMLGVAQIRVYYNNHRGQTVRETF